MNSLNNRLLNSMKKLISCTLFVTACLTSLLLTGCDPKKQETAPPLPPEVTVAFPTVQDVTNYKYFTGYTEARKEIDIRARVEGYLDSFSFEPGTLVKKGDLLFTIDPSPFEADVARAQADLETKLAEQKLADATLQRKESAHKQKAVSEIAVLEARAQVSKAKAQVKESKAMLITAQLQLSYTKMYAPDDGHISRNLVDAGNLVGAGGDKTLLATLVNYSPIFAYFNMDERSFLAFRKTFHKAGDSTLADTPIPVDLSLEGDSGYPYSGEGDFISNQVDLSTGTILVRASFANEDLFIMPGLFAKVRIPLNVRKDALLVPETALSSDQRGRFLLSVQSDGTVEYKAVETGALVDGLRVITNGIKDDDNIVIKGIQRARPGAKVSAKRAQD